MALVTLASAANAQFKEITKACQSDGGTFTAFPGVYTLKMKIGNKEFLDKLNITSITRGPGLLNSKENFKGEFTVVGVFTAQVEEGTLQYGIWADQNYLDFKIMASEGGQSYPVYFRAIGHRKDQACSLIGKAYSPTRDQEMGNFVITKDTHDCICPP